MALDLARLIDEVLTMAKKRQSQMLTPNEEYWNNVAMFERKRDADRETNVLRSGTDLEKQRLINTGQLDVTKEQSSGALARQKLVGESQERVADTQLTGTKYTADQNLSGHQYSSDKTLEGTKYIQDRTLETEKYKIDDPDKSLAAWITSGGMISPDKFLELRRKLREQNAVKPPLGGDKGDFYGKDLSKSTFANEGSSMTGLPARRSIFTGSSESKPISSSVIPTVSVTPRKNWITEGISGMASSINRRPEVFSVNPDEPSKLNWGFKNPWNR